jgi:hypothetical protein
VLFLEPFYEGFGSLKLKRTLGGTLWQIFAILRLAGHVKPFYRRMFEQQFAQWPESAREPLIDYHLEALRNTMKERKNLFTEVEAEIRGGGNLPDVPVIVLAAMGIDPFQAVLMPEAQLRELNTLKPALYAPLVRSVPRGKYREVDGAGHDTVWTDRPDAVITAVQDLLRTACTAATPRLISQAPVAWASSGVSFQGHIAAAGLGAANSAMPAPSKMTAWAPRTASIQAGSGANRGGSTPGVCARTANTTSSRANSADDQGNLGAGGQQLGKPLVKPGGLAADDDLVVGAVPPGQFLVEGLPFADVAVHDHDRGPLMAGPRRLATACRDGRPIRLGRGKPVFGSHAVTPRTVSLNLPAHTQTTARASRAACCVATLSTQGTARPQRIRCRYGYLVRP